MVGQTTQVLAASSRRPLPTEFIHPAAEDCLLEPSHEAPEPTRRRSDPLTASAGPSNHVFISSASNLSLSPHTMRVFLLLAALLYTASATHTNLTGIGAPITVSGISAGAFFATQFQIAFSGTVNGAGLIAGA